MSLARPPEEARTAARAGEGTPVNPRVSDTMRLARILCILLLVYAHAQPYQPGLPETLLSPMGLIHYLRQLLGHTSVPLLSLMSGYLLARALSQRPYTEALTHRFFSLIVPLVLWNLIYLAKETLESGVTAVPAVQEWPNAVLALTAQPAMAPLYFLRDAFVCALVSPALIFLARRLPRTAMAALLLNALLGLDGVLFLNGAIPLFYFAGCIGWVHQAPIPTQAMPREPVLAAGLAMALLAAAPFFLPPAWGASDPHSVPYAMLDIALRAAGCVVFWAAATRLLDTRAGEVLLRFEPIAFFIFCTHGMATGLWWMVIQRTGHADAAPVFLAQFALSPLLALLVCVPAVWALRGLAPRALSVLMGGRSPNRQQMARMTRPLAPAPLTRTQGFTP